MQCGAERASLGVLCLRVPSLASGLWHLTTGLLRLPPCEPFAPLRETHYRWMRDEDYHWTRGDAHGVRLLLIWSLVSGLLQLTSGL